MNDETDSSDDGGMSNGHTSTHTNQNFDPNPHQITVVKTSTGLC